MWSSGQLQVHCQALCGAIIRVRIRSLSWIGVSTLVDWVGLTSISSLKTRWLDCIEISWMTKASTISPRTTISSSANWLIWTWEGVGIAIFILDRKFCSQEEVLSIGHLIYHAHDYRWSKLHSCNWCIVNIWEGLTMFVHFFK
jgi:hypothetical protein